MSNKAAYHFCQMPGAWISPETMPEDIRQVMCFSSLYYHIEIAYDILFKGTGLAVLWNSLLRLTAPGMKCRVYTCFLHFKRQLG